MEPKRQRYTDAFRQLVLDDVKTSGVNAAAAKHKVAQSCVSRWASSAGVRREAPAAASSPAAARKSRTPRRAPPPSSSSSTASGTVRATPKAQRRSPAEPVASPPKVKASAGPAVEKPQAIAPSVPVRPARSRALSQGAARSAKRARVAKSYTPSARAEAVEHAAEHGVSAAAKKFKVSRFAIYAWQRGVAKAARGEGDSPTSGLGQKEIEAKRDEEIVGEWRKHPGLGPSQIRNQLRRASVKVSVNTVRRVMEDAGYRPPKVKREAHNQRYEATRPNHLWHLDFLHRHINRQSTFTLIILDDRSRFVVGHGVDDAERADLVIKTFEEAVERHGRPERVMDDKGSAFWSWRGISRFTELLTEMGIDQVVAQHKEWNGKVEVFNANLSKELFDAQRFYDVAEMKRRLAAHLHWYNHARTHHALGGLLVPADRYYGRVEEVLARIEAGAGRDAKDFVDLRERCLELFKVTSVGGVPEVWLLGQKLLGAASPS